jgi:hypothetical protein
LELQDSKNVLGRKRTRLREAVFNYKLIRIPNIVHAQFQRARGYTQRITVKAFQSAVRRLWEPYSHLYWVTDVGASLDFGVFVCSNCSGAHRGLGPTVTRIKSTHLDQWRVEWVNNMRLGNDEINTFWEAHAEAAAIKYCFVHTGNHVLEPPWTLTTAMSLISTSAANLWMTKGLQIRSLSLKAGRVSSLLATTDKRRSRKMCTHHHRHCRWMGLNSFPTVTIQRRTRSTATMGVTGYLKTHWVV